MSTPVQLPGLADLVEIGRGGYGIVYRAWQERLRRQVAVKVLSARLDGTAAHRFEQECRALGTVSGHPHIVAVYDAGTTADGQSFLVMPYYQDGSLLDRLNRHGGLPWAEALAVGVELAGALQTAHDAEILHRDIKPANVLVDGYGAVRLADFGQARHVDDDLTRTGGIVATPGFSAPEVLHGQSATARSDVFSLAATVMGLILGRGPFSADTDENIAALLLRVVNEPAPDLRTRGVPDRVCHALEAAMDKRPSRRPETAEAFGLALQQAQRDELLPVTPLTIAGRTLRGPTSLETTVVIGPDGVAGRVDGPSTSGPSTSGPSTSGPSTSGPSTSGSLAELLDGPGWDPTDTFDRSTVVVPPADGRPPSRGAPSSSGARPPEGGLPSGRGRRRWVAAAVAAVLVAGGGVAAVVITSGGKDASTGAGSSSPGRTSSAVGQPITVSDPAQLILRGSADLPSFAEVPESDPSVPGEWSIFWDLLGTEPDGRANVSPVPSCLGLPQLPAGSQKNVSGVYFSTAPGFARPGRYLVAQSMAFVMGSQELARQMVDPWQTKLAACELPVVQSSSYDDFAWINRDKSDQPVPGQSLAPKVQISRPELGTALPALVDQSFHRIRYQLVDKPGVVTIAPRYFDLITLSAGTSVVYLAMQSNGDPPAVAVRVAAVRSLLKKLVA